MVGLAEPLVSHGGLTYRRLWFSIGCLMLLVVLVGSLISINSPVDVKNIDKVQHVVAYAGMMFWWGMLQPGKRWAWALGLFLMGIGLEWAQAVTGYRDMSMADAVANSAGVALAWLLLLTPLQWLLRWVDRQLADRLNPGQP